MEKRMRKKQIVWLASAMILICSSHVWPQSVYPNIIKVPVTYFDFHSDGSNPDFNPAANQAAVLPGMVQPDLDAAGLPVGTATYLYSWGIGKWFRPWRQSQYGQGSDFLRPLYNAPPAGGRTLIAVNTVGYDTTCKNAVIRDSLLFNYVAGSDGVYEFGDSAFFPLDNKGFGNEGLSHNYSFAAAIHRVIRPRTGLIYNFQAHDDLWVFINSRLVVDLGGLDSLKTQNLAFDSCVAVKQDSDNIVDVFWTQRSGKTSSVKVGTNIVTACPATLLLAMLPNDTVTSGDSVVLQAPRLSNIYGSCINPDTAIHWKLLPTGTPSMLSTAIGPAATFYAVQAYTQYLVVLSAVLRCPNPCGVTDTLLDTARIYVWPRVMRGHLWIEPDANIIPNNHSLAMLVRLQYPDPVALVTLDINNSTATVAAVVRDDYGNFMRFPNKAIWHVIGDTGVVRLSQPDQPYLCKMERIGWGHVSIVLSDDSASVPDTIPVEIRGCCCLYRYRLVNASGGQTIDSIVINIDQDITVKLQAQQDCDATKWFDAAGKWLLAPIIPSNISVPDSAIGTWSFFPTATGEAILTIAIQRSVGYDTLKVLVIVKPSNAALGIHSIIVEKKKNRVEYYNLSGQRLHYPALRRTTGILFERIIAPDGSYQIRKINSGTTLRNNLIGEKR
jgi:fibro-slime domain-containing protein